MYFNEIVASLALLTVVVANYTDLRERIIPNRLTFSMIIIGVAIYLGYGAYLHDLFFAIKGAIGAGVTFAIGYAMWYLGAWAGGDVKLYAALGALLGGYTAPNIFTGHGLAFMNPPYPFFLTIFFNGIICLAPVLFGYVIVKSVQTEGVGRKIIRPLRESFPEILLAPFVIIAGSLLATELVSLAGLNVWIRLILSLVFVLLIYGLPRKLKAAVSLSLFGVGVYLYSLTILEYILYTFVAVFGIRLIISSLKVVNAEVLQREISITDLEEGMIPAEDIYERDGEAHRHEGPGFMERVKSFIRDRSGFRSLPDYDRLLADSSLAAGISEEQVEALQEQVEEGNLEDRIRIKEGLPFAPSFGLGVPIAIFLGDIYWWIVHLIGGL